MEVEQMDPNAIQELNGKCMTVINAKPDCNNVAGKKKLSQNTMSLNGLTRQ
jgi:hypothetical protein